MCEHGGEVWGPGQRKARVTGRSGLDKFQSDVIEQRAKYHGFSCFLSNRIKTTLSWERNLHMPPPTAKL
jgi:hypothetical protein